MSVHTEKGKCMKTVGIIGGFGPETTAQFQLRIKDLCMQQASKNRPGILVWSPPVSLQTEADLILRNRGIQKFLPILLSAAKKLENAGCDFLVLPCNTLH